MNQIQQMFKLQKQLNDDINGDKWINGITKEGRNIFWYRCIYMETCEAINSFNWKHWKNLNKKHNWNNLQTELVDIWHFIMSEAILANEVSYADKYADNIAPIKKASAQRVMVALEHILLLATKANIYQSKKYIKKIIDLFFEALLISGMNVLILYKRYIIKNQLNIFRQKHGYKDGTYNKFWNTVEDNVVAFNIMEDYPNLTPKELYAKFEEEYK